MIIKECVNHEEIVATFPVMRQLRPKLANKEDYFWLIQSLKKTEGYRLIAMFDGNNCIAIAGIRTKRSLFSDGKPEMHVDDLVTNVLYRSHGFGEKMFAWLKAECQELGCVSIILDSGTQRVDAHRFYCREGMKVSALHFLWKPDFEGSREGL